MQVSTALRTLLGNNLGSARHALKFREVMNVFNPLQIHQYTAETRDQVIDAIDIALVEVDIHDDDDDTHNNNNIDNLGDEIENENGGDQYQE